MEIDAHIFSIVISELQHSCWRLKKQCLIDFNELVGQCELVTYVCFVTHMLKALVLHYGMISNLELAL